MIVLDTNVVSEFRRQRPSERVIAWMSQQNEDELHICIPVVAEMAFGAHRIWLRDGSRRHFDSLNVLITTRFRDRILAFDVAAAFRHGEVRARREAMGRTIGLADAMIAAICIAHSATLATRNTRDFEGLDLKLVNPFEPVA